jgi:hypothetical protein
MRRAALRLLALSLLATASTGCNTAHPPLRPDPGATGYAMIGPYSVQRFVYSLPIVERAAVEAMTDMKIHSVRRKPKKDGVCFQGFMYDGRYVVYTLEVEGANTIATVTIDVYGDEPVSKILLERTSIRISTMPQSIAAPFDSRAITDAISHRGADVEGYRGVPLR